MENKRIEIVKNWPEPKLMRDIQVLLGFASFYQSFIQGFNKSAKPLTSMLRITTIRSAENLSASRTWLRMLRLEAEQASQPDQPRTRQRQWTWLKMLKLVKVMVVIIKRSKDHFSRSRADLHGSQLEAVSEWLWAKFVGLLAQGYKEQSSRRATQGSHSNQFLQKLTLHIYNKLSSHQVCGIYKLSWYYSTLSSNNIRAPVLFWIVFPFWWDLRTKFFNYAQRRLAYQTSLYIL